MEQRIAIAIAIACCRCSEFEILTHRSIRLVLDHFLLVGDLTEQVIKAANDQGIKRVETFSLIWTDARKCDAS